MTGHRSTIPRVLVGPSLAMTALALSGCSGALARAGPGLDAGTLGVSGVEGGVGAHAEVVAFRRPGPAGEGAGVGVELAGYATGGDGDPIAFTTLEVRYRGLREPTARQGAYWEVGSGLGLAWAPALQRAVVPLQAEVGLQRRVGPALLSVGLRERFLPMVGQGSPPVDAVNSLQLVVGLGWTGR